MDPNADIADESSDLSLKRSSEVSTVPEPKRPCVENESSDDEVKEKRPKRSSRRSRKSKGDQDKEEQKSKRKSRRSKRATEEDTPQTEKSLNGDGAEETSSIKYNTEIVQENEMMEETEVLVTKHVDECEEGKETSESDKDKENSSEPPTVFNDTLDNKEPTETKESPVKLDVDLKSSEADSDHDKDAVVETNMKVLVHSDDGEDLQADQDKKSSTENNSGSDEMDTTSVPDVQVLETAKDDEIVEVIKPQEKEKPEMIVLDDITNDDDAPGPDEVPTAEERGFWKAVEENPNDFASWTYLLQVVEKNGKLKQIQKAFSSFLELYPYCYGYWKKYADQMKKLVSNEAAYEVYNDAVVAIPLSVDLWTYFIHFIAEWKNGDENEIRTIYQRAVAACGQDFRSDKIWEAFVEWEKQTDNFRVLKLYKDFLGCVIQRHQYHFDKFREWVFFTPVKDIVTMGDIQELLARHKEETERVRLENERKAKEAAEKARLAAEAAAKEAAKQKIEAEEEERKLQEEIKRMQDDYKAATGYVSSKKDETEEVQDEIMKTDEAAEDDKMKTDEAAEDDKMKTEEEKEPETKEDEMKDREEDKVKVEEETTADKKDEVAEEEDVSMEPEEAAEIVDEEKEEDDHVVVSSDVKEETDQVDIEEPLPDTPDALTAKQEAAIREQILLDVAPVHEQVLADIQEVTPFEEGIKRPYFHVKELERVQLKNWKNYLNLIIEKKDNARTIILFERCLIACAFYEGFWIKYIKFMKKIDTEEARKIYRRACMVHLVKKPQIHLNWAAFEEELGHLEVAREALDHIDKGMPGLVAVTLRRAGLERRTGNIEQGADILKAVIESCRGRETRDFWAMKYVSYLQYAMKDVPTAKKFLNDQIERNTRNKRLYVRLLDLELSPTTSPPNTDRVLKVLQGALGSNLSIEDKTGFSHRRLTFLEEFGDDISVINESYDDHNKNYKSVVDEKNKETTSTSQSRDSKRRDTTTYSTTSSSSSYSSSNRNYNNRDRNYNNRDRNYNNNNYNSNNASQNNSYNAGYNMGNYNMQQAAQQQQHYQQWYSQYAAQQHQPYAAQTQYPQSRGY